MRAFFLPSLGKIKTLYTIFFEKAKYDKKVGQGAISAKRIAHGAKRKKNRKALGVRA